MRAKKNQVKTSLRMSEVVSESKRARKAQMSCFKTLYESRDGGLCLFEDAQGHIVAVNASKLV